MVEWWNTNRFPFFIGRSMNEKEHRGVPLELAGAPSPISQH